MLIKKLFFLLLVCFAMTSCHKENTSIDHSILSEAEFRNPASQVGIEESPNGSFVVISGASSKLRRNENGIMMNFNTKNLIPNNAYTLWWVVFGETPGPPILVTYAAGHIASRNGKGNFSSHLSVGDIFDNPLTAEVHLALRSHGPAQPGIIPSQIHTMQGGCTSGFDSGPALYPDSDVVGYCANVQVAMHPRN